MTASQEVLEADFENAGRHIIEGYTIFPGGVHIFNFSLSPGKEKGFILDS